VLILASASPRRVELLTAAGFRFETLPVDVDETRRDNETPIAYVRRLAEEKARAAFARHSEVQPDSQAQAGRRAGPTVLGADTTVVVEDDILGKPADPEDAARMLRRLSGRQHDVLTGIALVNATDCHVDVAGTMVEFADISEQEIAWYVGSGEPMDKAGAYAIQGLASRFVTRIHGSYSNVVGLPISLVYAWLRRYPEIANRISGSPLI
jgi:septum formation protein